MTRENVLLRRQLQEKQVLLADGATGTNLFAMGLLTGDAPELWNLQRPQRVRELHENFCAQGSDLFLTNTFGGNRYRLQLHGAGGRVREINKAAAKLAREVADAAGRRVIVAGSIGPTGEILAPIGSTSLTDVAAAYAEQAAALAEGGVDVLWLETFSSREELQCAITAANETGLAVVSTMSFDTNGRSMMGVMPTDLTQLAASATPPLLGSGANCGVGAAETLAVLLSMWRARVGGEASGVNDPLLVAKGNCGIPEWREGEIIYNGTPALMAEYARLARRLGARIIGGCCGTTFEHVGAMRRALDEDLAADRSAVRGAAAWVTPTLAEIVTHLGGVSNGVRTLLEGGATGQEPRGRQNRRRRH